MSSPSQLSGIWPKNLKEKFPWTEPVDGELVTFEEDNAKPIDDADSDSWDTSMTVLETVVNRPNTRIATISYDVEQKHVSIKLWNTFSAEQLGEWKSLIQPGTPLNDILRPVFDQDGKFLALYRESCIEVIDAVRGKLVRSLSIKETGIEGSVKPFSPNAIAIIPTGKRFGASVRLGEGTPEANFSVQMFPQPDNRIHPVDVLETRGLNDVSMGYLANGRRVLIIGRETTGHGIWHDLFAIHCYCFDVKGRSLVQRVTLMDSNGFVDSRLSYMTFDNQPCIIFRGYFLNTEAESGLWILAPEGKTLGWYEGPRMLHGTVPGGVMVLRDDEVLRVWNGKDAPKEIAKFECEDFPTLREVAGMAITENHVMVITDDEQVRLFRKQ